MEKSKMMMEVMKKAWELRKKYISKKISFSDCLKTAWAIVKQHNCVKTFVKGSEKQIKWAKDILSKILDDDFIVIKGEYFFHHDLYKKERFYSKLNALSNTLSAGDIINAGYNIFGLVRNVK